MNTIVRSRIYLPIAAMILTAALAVPAAVQKHVPFKGAIQGSEIHTLQGGPPPTTLLVDGNATGIATHVGQFSYTYEITVSLADGTGVGSAQLIAANGDSIDATIAASSEPADTPGVFRITEINTIIGGTGRFAEAKGSFTVERLVSSVSTFGSFQGTITSPGAAH